MPATAPKTLMSRRLGEDPLNSTYNGPGADKLERAKNLKGIEEDEISDTRLSPRPLTAGAKLSATAAGGTGSGSGVFRPVTPQLPKVRSATSGGVPRPTLAKTASRTSTNEKIASTQSSPCPSIDKTFSPGSPSPMAASTDTRTLTYGSEQPPSTPFSPLFRRGSDRSASHEKRSRREQHNTPPPLQDGLNDVLPHHEPHKPTTKKHSIIHRGPLNKDLLPEELGGGNPPPLLQLSQPEPILSPTTDKSKRQITISPQVMEIDATNTATFHCLNDEEKRQQGATGDLNTENSFSFHHGGSTRRGSRRLSRRRSRAEDGHAPTRKHSVAFGESPTTSFPDHHHDGGGVGNSGERHGFNVTDHSLLLSDDHSQLFPHRASFFFKERDGCGDNSRSSSMVHSRPSMSFSGRRHTRTPEGRRSSRVRPRRKSMHKRRQSRHRATSILELPDGGYVRGSPFRRDRFADLGPCPSTKHHRIFCYNSFGDLEDPALILINGLGSSCTLWPDDFCEAFAAQGLFVIRFDNRDSGLTSHWDGFKSNSVYKAAIMGLFFKQKPPYTLADMARDVLDLMDNLGIGKTHLLGISMGGMIAQTIALQAPDRVRSLILMATHCPGYRVESPSLKVLISNFLDSPKSTTLDGIVDFYIRRRQALIGGYVADTPAARQMFRKSIIRAPGDGKAVRRQFCAIQSEPSKEKAVKELARRRLFPVGVIHGRKDQLIPKANGVMLNTLWIGSELCLFDQMGHAFAEELHKPIVDFAMTIISKGDAT